MFIGGGGWAGGVIGMNSVDMDDELGGIDPGGVGEAANVKKKKNVISDTSLKHSVQTSKEFHQKKKSTLLTQSTQRRHHTHTRKKNDKARRTSFAIHPDCQNGEIWLKRNTR